MINQMKDRAEVRKILHTQALAAPKSSGVYLWKDESGAVLYVGKAKSLKNRLSSYFSSNKDVKTRHLVSRAYAIEYITTDNEYEALLLENTLIKKYNPRYNISLKDGKTYPVIKITNEDFPRIYRTRRIFNDGAHYFGPYPNVVAVDTFLDFVKRNYPLRQCKKLKKRKSPCLYYHIGRCSAPCAGYSTKKKYQEQIQELHLILSGDPSQSIHTLQTEMKKAAKNLEFEKAARLRDGIQAIQQLSLQNAVVDMDPQSRDYIAWAAEGVMVSIAVLQMRGGTLVGRELYRARSLKDEGELVLEFLMAFYTNPDRVPPAIFVQTKDGLDLAKKWFHEHLGAQTHIEAVEIEREPDFAEAAEPAPEYACSAARSATPLKKHSVAMAMAYFNAKEDAQRRLKEHGDYPGLTELQSILNLSTVPQVIEGFDISHLQGQFPVASLITFTDGIPDRKKYRMFNLKTTDGIIDDIQSMKEVITRRYTRLLNEQAELPDLILVDGGLGQVNAARSILAALDLDLPLIGLAEKNEEIYLPGNSKPLVLPKRSDALRLLQRVRDETHRFANKHNQNLRSKNLTQVMDIQNQLVAADKSIQYNKDKNKND